MPSGIPCRLSAHTIGVGLAFGLLMVPAYAADSLTAAAIEKFNAGDLDEAAALEERAVTKHCQNWFAHATLAYLRWQQGDVTSATISGEKAVKLAPRNLSALTNLALMKEALDDCQGALPLYERAWQIAPESTAAALGTARCKSKLGQPAEAQAILEKMLSAKNATYEWNIQLAKVSSQMDHLSLASQAALRALDCAGTPEQKAEAKEQILLALLRDNRVEEAKPYFFDAIQHSKDYELYIRSASALLGNGEPGSATKLVDFARKNLTEFDDCEGFYRLGRIFERKAFAPGCSTDDTAAWMMHAEAAFARAIALNPHMAKYHLAMAGVLRYQDKTAAMKEELQKASSDPLAKALLAQFDTEAMPKLTEVRFNTLNLNCACHVGKLAAALEKIPGVVFVDIIAKEPYKGSLIIDESVSKADDAFTTAKQRAFEGMKGSFESVGFQVLEKQSITNDVSLILSAQDASDGDLLSFIRQFAAIQPNMPVESIAAR